MSHANASFNSRNNAPGRSMQPGDLEPLPGNLCGHASIVIPVKNNQAGVDRLLAALRSLPENDVDQHILEVIIVDDGSSPPVHVPPDYSVGRQVNRRPVLVYRGAGRGPAAARNLGAAKARGAWLLFMDSDCVPTESTLRGYRGATPGSVAYAGTVRALSTTTLSRYYESQEILSAPEAADGRPAYLVTANALVLRRAFQAIGGFDESIDIAGGEDIDLSLRLAKVGRLDFARESVVLHDFSDGLTGFWKRFARYGRGNRMVEERHGSSGEPRPFAPKAPSPANWIAAYVQYQAMRWGYEGPKRVLLKQALLWLALGGVTKVLWDASSPFRFLWAAKKGE